MLLVVRRRHQHADVAADHLGLPDIRTILGAAIERLDAALGVDDDDAVDRRVEDRVEPLRAGRCGRRHRPLRRLGCVQPVIEPGDDQAGPTNTPSES